MYYPLHIFPSQTSFCDNHIQNQRNGKPEKGEILIYGLRSTRTVKVLIYNVDDYSCVRHSPGHKPEREPLRGVCGSYLRQSWNVEMASSLQRVEKNSR
jgi:hypothetical protein